jgi:hypothetical protein
MAIDLHFICRHGARHHKIDGGLWETGNWHGIGKATADEATGGRVYLHEKQRSLAWHGGTIVAWRESDEPGRKVFTYRVDGPFRVRCPGPWGQEMAIVRR